MNFKLSTLNRRNRPSINCIASDLYGSDHHGDPIVGSAVIVHANEESLELMTNAEAKALADGLNRQREHSIEKISKAFGLRVETVPYHVLPRQPCKKNDMER